MYAPLHRLPGCCRVVQIAIFLFLDHFVAYDVFWYFIISKKITYIEFLLHASSTILASSSMVVLRFPSIDSSFFFTVESVCDFFVLRSLAVAKNFSTPILNVLHVYALFTLHFSREAMNFNWGILFWCSKIELQTVDHIWRQLRTKAPYRMAATLKLSVRSN